METQTEPLNVEDIFEHIPIVDKSEKKHEPLLDDDEISQLTSPTKRKQQPYDRTLLYKSKKNDTDDADETSEEEQLEDVNFMKKRKLLENNNKEQKEQEGELIYSVPPSREPRPLRKASVAAKEEHERRLKEKIKKRTPSQQRGKGHNIKWITLKY